MLKITPIIPNIKNTAPPGKIWERVKSVWEIIKNVPTIDIKVNKSEIIPTKIPMKKCLFTI